MPATSPNPSDPWSDLFPSSNATTAAFDPLEEMLRLIVYDISNSRRLRRVAEACADYGVRVQESVFECWLEQDRFEQLWRRLESVLDHDQDKIAAYVLDRGAARDRRAIGKKMAFSMPRARYVL